MAELPAPATAAPTTDACAIDEGCLTCGDVAVALTVVEVADADALCRDDDGRAEWVATDLVGPVASGDRLLVHARVAIERVDGAAPDPAGDSA